jgi:hypothetical protein
MPDRVTIWPGGGHPGGEDFPPIGQSTMIYTSHFIPREEERHLSFVLETASTPDLPELKRKIEWALVTNLGQYFPELLSYNSQIWKAHERWRQEKKPNRMGIVRKRTLSGRIEDIQEGKHLELPIKLEMLFPGSEDTNPVFGLNRFVLLTLPVFKRAFHRQFGKSDGPLYDVAYKLKHLVELVSVDPAVSCKNYTALSADITEATDQNYYWDRDWHIDSIRAAHLPPGLDGSGVVIGHLDTGWTRHSELNFPPGANFRFDRDWNVFNDASTAEEPVESGDINRYHGTMTASVMISSPDRTLEGVAPGTTILPVRCIRTVLLLAGVNMPGYADVSGVDVARAVWYATQENVDIISMSLGGYPVAFLEAVVAHAVYSNIIVVAAAGQIWPFIVAPAMYPECIAVAGCNASDHNYRDSSQSSQINIAAPGEEVLAATWDNSDPPEDIVVSKSGTSFASAITAAVAALWLQFYGRQALIRGLQGRATLQELLMEHVESTARTPVLWDTNAYGPGIINVERLLNRATLPDLATFQGRDWNTWERQSNMELLYTLFENTDPVVLRERGETIFAPEGDFEQVMADLGAEIIRMLMAVEESYEIVKTVMESGLDAAGEVVENIENAVENVVDAVVDTVSNTLKAIAGWF